MSAPPEDGQLTGESTPEDSCWNVAEVGGHQILDNLKSYLKHGDEEPAKFDIQAAAFSRFRRGAHVMMHSEKASGKTTAMVVQILGVTHLLNMYYAKQGLTRRTSRTPLSLILVPTESLCSELAEIAQCLILGSTDSADANHLIRVLSIHNSADPFEPLAGGADLIIGTPERLVYLDGHGCIDWGLLSVLGLDRVDGMVDPEHTGCLAKLLHPESGTISRAREQGYSLITTSSKMTPELRSQILQIYVGPRSGFKTYELSVETREVIKTTEH